MDTSAVTIRIVAAVNRLEHFCSSVAAIWTAHFQHLLSLGPGTPYPNAGNRDSWITISAADYSQLTNWDSDVGRQTCLKFL